MNSRYNARATSVFATHPTRRKKRESDIPTRNSSRDAHEKSLPQRESDIPTRNPSRDAHEKQRESDVTTRNSSHAAHEKSLPQRESDIPTRNPSRDAHKNHLRPKTMMVMSSFWGRPLANLRTSARMTLPSASAWPPVLAFISSRRRSTP